VLAPANKRKRVYGPYYLVAWRDEWGETGSGQLRGLEKADDYAREFTKPRAWAVIIDPLKFTFIKEYGVRFADLKRLARKPPVRVPLSGGQRATAAGVQAC
jgi:hypothetical protein